MHRNKLNNVFINKAFVTSNLKILNCGKFKWNFIIWNQNYINKALESINFKAPNN